MEHVAAHAVRVAWNSYNTACRAANKKFGNISEQRRAEHKAWLRLQDALRRIERTYGK